LRDFDAIAKQLGVVEASLRGAIEILRVFVDFGFDLNAADPFGATPMLAAVVNSHLETVRFLAEHGTDMTGPGLRELLSEALSTGDCAIFRYVITESNFDLLCGGIGKSMLEQAIHLRDRRIIDFLLDQSLTLDGLCLSSTILQRDFALFYDLVDRGGDINAYTEGLAPPIIHFIDQCHVDDVENLIELGATLDSSIMESWPNCIRQAIGQKDRPLLELLLSTGPNLSKVHGVISSALHSWVSVFCRDLAPRIV
jgi:ankyrin repeat protein